MKNFLSRGIIMKIKNIPEEYETEIYENIADFVKNYSMMSNTERKFINGIIREIKPKKVLELGVATGGSTCVILNALIGIESSYLYSIDYNHDDILNPEKKIGFLVEEIMSDYMDKWTLFTGGIAAKFLGKIGGNIDLCLIDTAHILPGEILDFLMILPFMTKDGIVIVHDTNDNWLDLFYGSTAIAGNILFSVVKAEKIQTKKVDNYCEFFHEAPYFKSRFGIKQVPSLNSPFPNIGAFQVNQETMDNISDLFFALSLNWEYLPSNEDMEHVTKLLYKYYPKENVESLIKLYNLNKKKFDRKEKECK
jgi:predicted O-methyltransferase YrrM